MPTLEVIELPEERVSADGIQRLADITDEDPSKWIHIHRQVLHRQNSAVIEGIFTSTDPDDETEYRILYELGQCIVKIPPSISDEEVLAYNLSMSPFYPKILDYMVKTAHPIVANRSKTGAAKAVLENWHIFKPTETLNPRVSG